MSTTHARVGRAAPAAALGRRQSWPARQGRATGDMRPSGRREPTEPGVSSGRVPASPRRSRRGPRRSRRRTPGGAAARRSVGESAVAQPALGPCRPPPRAPRGGTPAPGRAATEAAARLASARQAPSRAAGAPSMCTTPPRTVRPHGQGGRGDDRRGEPSSREHAISARHVAAQQRVDLLDRTDAVGAGARQGGTARRRRLVAGAEPRVSVSRTTIWTCRGQAGRCRHHRCCASRATEQGRRLRGTGRDRPRRSPAACGARAILA